jgi:maltooligosyltrehalose trehalohydrolase
MQRGEAGWHELLTDRAKVGGFYRFVLPDERRVPDPASRFQPRDVEGPSELVDLSTWVWTDSGWAGKAWHDAVLYELHVGTFTREGTFSATIDKLDYLADLGITTLELMPVADFPGKRNWGYDGVLLYAPDSAYGRPEELKALIEAAHSRGLMVIQDVVYNHFGPAGNYLPLYAPLFFTGRHKTPWGAAVNFDSQGCEAVREFVIQNALYWLNDFHFDGLRLDAVHAIVDESPTHILEELAERVRAGVNREVHLILENENNHSRYLEQGASARPRLFTAQWNDDVHHVLHTAVTGERQGYYGDYTGDTEKLGRALAEGFAFQGEIMPYRGDKRGQPSAQLRPTAFVAFLQNHDQIGNRAFGERISVLTTAAAVRAAAAVYLLLPQIPMLFMGEEWNATEPFPFFCDFGPGLADAVREGRREEFSQFPEFRDPERRKNIPDPQAESTFESAKLRWDDITGASQVEWRKWHQRILTTRREHVVPMMMKITRGGKYRVIGPSAVEVHWQAGDAELILSANLSAAIVHGFPTEPGHVIWQEGDTGDDGAFGPWTVHWRIS